MRTLKTSLPLLTLLGLAACSAEPTPEDQGQNDVSRIVYAVRQHTEVDAEGRATEIDVASGMGQVMDYGRYHPGGRLEVLDLRSGDIRNLTAAADYAAADISSVDVSYDGTRVLFTMKTSESDKYHIYWASLEEGSNEIPHQLTFGPYDDINAIWTTGNRIAFVTNQAYTPMGVRADEYNHSQAVTQLGTISLEGGDADRRLCSQNLSHTVTLFSMADGRVGFSRWEHLENVNDVKLFAMNPDCTQMTALGGQHGKPGNSLVQVTEGTTPNVFYGVVTNRENTIQAGSLFLYDARSSADPLRADEEKDDAYTVITPNIPTGDDPSPDGRYRAPAMLPDGRLLVSWAPGVVNDQMEFDLTPPDYGIYVFHNGTNAPVVNHEGSWELYARPIVARDEPAILPTRQNTVDGATPAIIGSIDVKQTSLYARHGETVEGAQFVDGTHMDVALEDAVKVRIIEGFSTEAAPGATMFGLTMAEGAAMLGEARVNEDGSWLAEIPPYVPVHLQPIDRFDLAIRNQTTWIQGMPGEGRVCGGCHEDRSKPVLPADQALTIAAGNDPERFNLAIADRVEYPWYGANPGSEANEIQVLLNAKCASCHNETMNGSRAQEFYEVSMTDAVSGMVTETYQIPRLDLSSREITVTYDNETKPWPASYVSLFYPAALEMEMGDGAMVTGTVPPRWAVPSDARHSRLIEVLNVTASNDPTEYAWALGEAFPVDDNGGTIDGVRWDHGADVEVALTREELVMLIRAIDMGGQYYSRQNTAFVPYGDDPVVGGGTRY